jgi:hypothetical protein
MKDQRALLRLLASLKRCVPLVPAKMNLALIDPFQLAQDYPDALTNDLRKYPSLAVAAQPALTKGREWPCHHTTIQPAWGLSRVRQS